MTQKILSLRMQRNRRRVTVKMEDGSVLTLAPILAATLKTGQTLDAGKIAALQREDLLEESYQRTLGLIARRPRSREEIARYLRRRKLDDTAAGEVMERLTRRGFLDDAEFARAWVENRQAFRPRSQRALRAELRRLGVAEGDIQPALAGLPEGEAALAAARRRAARLTGRKTADDREARAAFTQNIVAHLAMRGFAYELARETARQVWEETRAAEAPDEESEDGRL
jgi:regulatory protein